MTRALAAIVASAVLAAVFASSVGATGSGVGQAFFLRGDVPVPVSRAAPTVPVLLQALLAGPRPAERARGLRSAIPARSSLRSVTVRQGIATVDLSAAFALGLGRSSLRERVDQVVRTALSAPGVKGVRLKVEGGVPVGLFPGYDLRRPVVAPRELEQIRPGIRDVQQALADLGFMDAVGITGEVDARTTTAVLAFQKWAALGRTGVLDRATTTAILESTRPRPALRAPGRRIEVQLDRQLALLIRDGRVVRTVHISSGAGGATPLGTFHVYRKEKYSWSIPFSVWLPWASYFVGGIAFHEFESVPIYAASHGCIRVSHYDAEMLYGFADFGTQVDVFRETVEVRA